MGCGARERTERTSTTRPSVRLRTARLRQPAKEGNAIRIFMPSIAQHVMNALAEAPSDWSGRAKMRLALRLRSAINQMGDPTVEVVLKGRVLEVPLSHDLPLFRAVHPEYSENVGRIAALLARSRHGPLKVIDVGANVGDTVALISAQVEASFLCVEGNPRFSTLLRKNTAFLDKRVSVADVFLGANAKLVGGDVREAGGTACLEPTGDSAAGPRIQLLTLDELLCSHPQFRDARLLKVDTDGMDDEVLFGAEQLLSGEHPIVFFEHDPALLHRRRKDPEAVFEFLRRLGYPFAVFFDNFGRLIAGTRLSEVELLKDLVAHAWESDSGRYLDVCAFSAEDEGLFHAVREQERNQRRNCS